VLECVVNISEGRNLDILKALRATAGSSLRDLHAEEFHNRSVFTLINPSASLKADVQALVTTAFDRLDLRLHEGVHPRFGVVDVVPFVALEPGQPAGAVELRDATAQWISENFPVPTFLYGPLDGALRSLPEVRRRAFAGLVPDFGPATASPKLGAVAVGARPVLVAWNLWLSGVSRDETRALAKAVRRDEVRALAFRTGAYTQVSCNLIEPLAVGPYVVYDEVAALLPTGAAIERCEVVGLVPGAVLDAEDRGRWEELGLSEDQTIESRL
jgi:glutamate formiminotransferase / 5-formyltetrahydrofolate cyclo-ligase